MNKSELLNKPLWQMNGEEFLYLQNYSQENSEDKNLQKSTELIYGYAGIMQLMNCGRSKAQKMLIDGDFGDAVIQSKRKIIIDKERALHNLRLKTK